MLVTYLSRANAYQDNRGFSFVELIVTVAVVTLVFGSLLVGYTKIVQLISESRLKSGALALATEQMEYIKSLPYDDIATLGGVPAGLIPQISTTTLNGVTYSVRVLITYVDDPADGLGSSDTNVITNDYKAIKVSVSWTTQNGTQDVTLTSNAIPRGIETTAGGGTIRVNVFDAQVNPLPGATVRFVNDTLSPSIDTSRISNASGEAYLSGAPAGSGYEIFVTRSGYSTDQTYQATTSNPNPVTPPVSVAESLVSTMNFQIDQVSELTLATKGVPIEENLAYSFADDSQTATSTDTTIVSGELRLLETGGVYASFGTSDSVFFTPATVQAWDSLFVVDNIPSQTSRRIHIMYDVADPKLVPDSDLPGNSAGFTSTVIDLRTVSAVTYPALAFRVVLETTDTLVTPKIDAVTLKAVASQATLTGVPLNITSYKLIGSSPGLIPKYNEATTTDGSGQRVLSGMEWGQYTITVDPAYTVAEFCPSTPLILAPNSVMEATQHLRPSVPHSLRVEVVDVTDQPVPWSTVRLQRGAYNVTQTTSQCGQTLFVVPSAEVDYQLTVERFDFSPLSVVDVNIVGESTLRVILSP